MSHVFQFEMRDQFGRSWCAVCGLPRVNRVHDLPDVPPDNLSRAAGERDNDEGDE